MGRTARAAAFVLALASASRAGEAPHDDRLLRAAVASIQSAYRLRVKPIFEAKCFPCHEATRTLPWYGKIPVPYFGNPVARDVREGRRHLDVTGDAIAPLGDAWLGPEAKLRAIRSVVRNDSMPPWLYLLMHSSARLTETERSTILAWATSGLEALARSSAQTDVHGDDAAAAGELLRNRCTRCHNEKLPDPDGRVYRFDNLAALRDDPVLLGDPPDEGTLYEVIKKGKMPPKGADEPLTPDERKLLIDWITGG